MFRFAALVFCCIVLFSVASPSPCISADTVSVDGDVASPKHYGLDELAKFKQVTVSLTEHDGTASKYEGVEVSDLLKDAGVSAGEHPGKAVAIYVSAIASDGYQVVFGLGELTQMISGRMIILATSMNGKPLGANFGPFRVVVKDDKVQARCIRMVTELKVVQLRKWA
jgi:DMSO/TMAO reductase YedYZ molybdopterin-dependent catalytic subunit